MSTKNATDKFHEKYEGVVFHDDTPLHVWNDAWTESTRACVELLYMRAANSHPSLSESLTQLARELGESNENN